MIWVEFVFMMLVLKIPLIYVCWIVWWAVKQEPPPLEGAAVTVAAGDPSPSRWLGRGLRPSGPRAPHGRPVRSYPRVATARRAAVAGRMRR